MANEACRFYGFIRQLAGLPNDPKGCVPKGDPVEFYRSPGSLNHPLHSAAKDGDITWLAANSEAGLDYGGVRGGEWGSHVSYYICGPLSGLMTGLSLARKAGRVKDARVIAQYLRAHWALLALTSIAVTKTRIDTIYWKTRMGLEPLDSHLVTCAASGARWHWFENENYIQLEPRGETIAWVLEIGPRTHKDFSWDPKREPTTNPTRRPWAQHVFARCCGTTNYSQPTKQEPWGLADKERFNLKQIVTSRDAAVVLNNAKLAVGFLTEGGAQPLYRPAENDGLRYRIRRTMQGVETASLNIRNGNIAGCQVTQVLWSGKVLHATAVANNVEQAANRGWKVIEHDNHWECVGDGPQSPLEVPKIGGQIIYDILITPKEIKFLGEGNPPATAPPPVTVPPPTTPPVDPPKDPPRGSLARFLAWLRRRT